MFLFRRKGAFPSTYQYHESFNKRYRTKKKWSEETDAEVMDWNRVRRSMEHENFLLFERAKLLTASQAFFFSAYGFIYTKDNLDVNQSWIFLLVVISFLAAFTSFFIAATMYEARHQHSKLEIWWYSRVGTRISNDEWAEYVVEQNFWNRLLHHPICTNCIELLRIRKKNISKSMLKPLLTPLLCKRCYIEETIRINAHANPIWQKNTHISLNEEDPNNSQRHPPICGRDATRAPFFNNTPLDVFATVFAAIWSACLAVTLYMWLSFTLPTTPLENLDNATTSNPAVNSTD